MPTIKELYDQGQRQFPMKGGGISPILHIEDVEFWDEDGCGIDEIVPQFMSDYYKGVSKGIGWEINGKYNNNCALDLLPEPLPNQSDKEQRIATLEAAVLEAVKVIEELSDCVQDGLPTRLQDAARLKAIAGGQDNETK